MDQRAYRRLTNCLFVPVWVVALLIFFSSLALAKYGLKPPPWLSIGLSIPVNLAFPLSWLWPFFIGAYAILAWCPWRNNTMFGLLGPAIGILAILIIGLYTLPIVIGICLGSIAGILIIGLVIILWKMAQRACPYCGQKHNQYLALITGQLKKPDSRKKSQLSRKWDWFVRFEMAMVFLVWFVGMVGLFSFFYLDKSRDISQIRTIATIIASVLAWIVINCLINVCRLAERQFSAISQTEPDHQQTISNQKDI